MISAFNLTKLENLLKDFYTLTQIRITVFDENFQELIAYPANIPSFCQLIRTDEQALKNCRACDNAACKTASGQRTSYTYKCHAGLTESIMPLYLGNILVGYLLFGHVFPYQTHEEGWKEIKKHCNGYQIDLDALKKACYDRPIISENYITSASHILEAVASYVCMEHMAVLKHKTLAVQIDEYITNHFSEEIDVPSICKHFQIGKTYLYRIAKQCYNTGVAEHIRNLRIEKAKQLLSSQPKMQIGEIAVECGFSDYNYFITVFKRVTGMSPKAYRISFY